MNKYKKVGIIVSKAFRFCWPYILLNIFVVLLTTFVGILTNFVNSEIVNQLTYDTQQGQLSVAFFALILVYMCFYLFQRVSGFLGSLGYNFFQLKVEQLFQDIFNWKSYDCKQEKFYDNDFLEQFSFAQNGIGKISMYINNIIRLIFSNITTIITAIVLFSVYEPFLILLLIVVFATSYFINRYLANEEYTLDKEQIPEQRYHNYYKGLLVDKSPAKELRIYNLKSHFINIWTKFRDKLALERLKLSLKKIKLSNYNSLFKILVRIISTFLLLIGIYSKNYDVGTFVLLLGFTNSSLERIDALSRAIVSGTYRDVKYIADYYDFVFPITNNEIASIRDKEYSHNADLMYGAFCELRLQNICYSYPNSDTKAIDNISFTLNKGEIVSILGYNGSGKTTLSKLINGSLFPQAGTITLNGVEINQENKRYIHRYFGVAPQEYSKFSLSVEDFIKLRCNDSVANISLENIYDEVNMKNLLSKYPNREKTILGKAYSPEGIDLSGGEWQMLNITSAYIGNPEILILDEPTASIDPLKEEQLIVSLKAYLCNKTAILISHRLGFARIADRIIIMKDGKIVEQGSHDQLIKLKGLYYEMFNGQKQLYDEQAI